MARALQDAGAGGYVVTVDQLPHDRPMLWNCIDDHEGPRTRAQLLSDYPELLSRIVFLRGRSDEVIKTLDLSRINFAFLDATHKIGRAHVYSSHSYAPRMPSSACNKN